MAWKITSCEPIKGEHHWNCCYVDVPTEEAVRILIREELSNQHKEQERINRQLDKRTKILSILCEIGRRGTLGHPIDFDSFYEKLESLFKENDRLSIP